MNGSGVFDERETPFDLPRSGDERRHPAKDAGARITSGRSKRSTKPSGLARSPSRRQNKLRKDHGGKLERRRHVGGKDIRDLHFLRSIMRCFLLMVWVCTTAG